MKRNTKPAPKGAAADASGLRPLPSPGDLVKYKSRFFGDLYVAKVLSVDQVARTASLDVSPGSSESLLLTTIPVHDGEIDDCPKGSCFR